jgi:hypothetical protein
MAKKTTYRGTEIMFKSPKERIMICYNKNDMGRKYKLYTKNEFDSYDLKVTFDSMIQASNYASKMYD